MEANPPATPRHTLRRYRCSLPGLAGFTTSRCEGTGRLTTTERVIIHTHTLLATQRTASSKKEFIFQLLRHELI